ncbi:hypothetical protein [Burkholderia cenocepacia]|uniref:hypothetical protein n=1 Tax=Burkholderia cenocepacia TaxID=95486 RepID=UPI00223879D0|nr:hypothetical protein [Burkholderia cenocepacia]MCW5141058.1 hypothetical protein [Burkholderia cenocepacia]
MSFVGDVVKGAVDMFGGGGGLVSAGASLLGGMLGSDASQNAAATQAEAARYAADMQWKQFEQTRQDLAPYLQLGTASINPLLMAMGYTPQYDADGKITGMGVNPNNPLQQPFKFDASDLENTPGYQFNLKQGMKAVDNSNAARGLGLSGAQLKGISDYTTGLAQNTYQQQFGNALTGYQTNYNSAANNVNRLLGLMQTGQNSAAQVGSMGANAAAGAGNLLTQAGNATAAGQMGSANAWGNALSNVGNMASMYGMMNQLKGMYA